MKFVEWLLRLTFLGLLCVLVLSVKMWFIRLTFVLCLMNKMVPTYMAMMSLCGLISRTTVGWWWRFTHMILAL